MRRLISLLVFLSLLTGCSSLRYKPDVPIACDSVSRFASDYFATLNEDKKSHPVASANLRLYGPGTLSSLSFGDVRNPSPIEISELFAYERPQLPLIRPGLAETTYAVILIPPRASAQYFAQWEAGGDANTTVDYPSLLAVPEHVARTGRCTSADSAFLISTIENDASASLPQLIVSRETLEAIVTALYLDKNSNDPSYLIAKISDAGFVNETTWRGWTRMVVRPAAKWIWQKPIIDEGEELSERSLGRPISSPSSALNASDMRAIDADVIEQELAFIEGGWFGRIGDYRNALARVSANIAALEQAIKAGSVTAASFKQAIAGHVAATNAAKTELEKLGKQIAEQRPWFVTQVEENTYVEALSHMLDDLHVQFNKVSEAYAAATRIQNSSVIDPEQYLSGVPGVVGGELREPMYKLVNHPEKNLGTTIQVRTVAFPSPVPQGKFVITIRALLNVTDTLNSASDYLARLIKSKDSCSKHVGQIRQNVGETVRPDRFERQLEANVESRTCWKIFGKRGWTRNFRAVAKGEIFASISPLPDNDLSFRYGWRGGVRIVVINIGMGDEWTFGSVKKLLGKGDLEKAKAYELAIKEARFIKDNNGRAYLAVSIDTKALTPAEFGIAYALLSTLL